MIKEIIRDLQRKDLFQKDASYKTVRNKAIKVSLIYTLFGVSWIFLSDRFLELLFKDIELYKHYQTLKGLFFIFITTIMVYILIHRRLKLTQKEFSKTETAYEELRKVHNEMLDLESELIYQRIFNESIIMEAPAIIITWNDEGRFLSVNPFGQKLLGYTQEELKNAVWKLIIPPGRQQLSLEIYEKIKREKQFINYEGPLITKDGKRIDVLWSSRVISSKSVDMAKTYVSIGTDINERKSYEEKVRYMAYYDSLTGLPNRAMFDSEVNKQLTMNNNFIIAYLDIDNFKNINDSMGHQVGDEFLKYLANCLLEKVQEPNLVARLGGDEFAILYYNTSSDMVLKHVEDIVEYISKTWSIENRQFYITMSVGIVICPEHGNDSTTLLKNADIAMYAAKMEGKNRILLYKEDINVQSSWQANMINNLQYGIEGEQFTLVFQPQYKLKTGEIMGMEALVRWAHPEEGFIPPAEFIPLAEQTGQIYRLERWIVSNALKRKRVWEELGFTDIVLSINLSSKTLTSDINFKELESILNSYQVDYSRVVIEITETADISDVDVVIKHLERLKGLGIKIALDDFGTGYSSLNYLKKFPIDIIKLDRSFINAISEESIDTLLIKNILALAKDLKFEVVAEGIETNEQMEYLINNSCELGQGYLLSRPVPEDKVRSLLKMKYAN